MKKSMNSSGRREWGASRLAAALLTLTATLLEPAAGAEAHGGGDRRQHGDRPRWDDRPRLPSRAFSIGDTERGALTMPLHRGNVVPFELMVVATPNNCEGEMWLSLEWDKQANYVKVRLIGRDALEPYPDVDRTEGVNFFPNEFFPEGEDVVDGRYQFWIASAGGPVRDFYYDGETLELLGSELDFETPPEGSIPIAFPTLVLFGTPFIQPDENGDVDFEWTFSYDKAVRGDRPELAHFTVTFVPPHLCEVNPNRIDQSNLRPYISDPVPASEAHPFSWYLESGLIFDLTVETAEYHTEPPGTTLIATYSGTTAVAGMVPKGWTLDIDAVFQNVAPFIKPWEGAGQCEDWYPGLHTQNLNFCPAPE